MTWLVAWSDSRKLVVIIFRIKLDLRDGSRRIFRVPRHGRGALAGSRARKGEREVEEDTEQ